MPRPDAEMLPMFRGLSAFPITPITDTGIDEDAYRRLIRRLAEAKVDSIGALGSTGLYPYLTREERRRTAAIAIAEAGVVPVMIGIGALRTDAVLRLAEDAQEAGAAAVLLAPVSYQKLTVEEVYELYATVVATLSVPLCVYDNPGTTRFAFSDELYGRVAALPGVGAVKIPGPQPDEAADRIASVRGVLPPHVALGVSGDEFAAAGLNAGADGYFSVIGGLFPDHALRIVRAALARDPDAATRASDELLPLWELMRVWGSLRVTYTAAELLDLAPTPSLPPPLRGLPAEPREQLRGILAALDVRV